MAGRKRAPGGWLMVEVAVGGVMASVVLGALLVNIGDAMDRTTVVGRSITASELAQQAVEQARAVAGANLTNLSDGSNVSIAVPTGLTGTYARTRTVTSGTETVNGIALSYKDITVTVTFPLNDGTTKTTVLTTRVYG